ncbi:MAG: ribbon-helix-helix domain-containing protein [Methanobacterium sp. ERen5]|nr:MAG: ribbon-helix-helix domain-containing protein [Methanobacterium sp. ERen5]
MVKNDNKTKNDYSSISLPNGMLTEIGKIIKKDESLGFTKSEFVKDAVRDYIIKYREITKNIPDD